MSLTGQPNAMGGREMGYMGPGLPGQRSVLSARTACSSRPSGALCRAPSAPMAKDVDSALTAIIRRHGSMSEEHAHDYKRELVAAKRYVRDVY